MAATAHSSHYIFFKLAASMDERSAEVARVIHVLRAHESSPATLLQPGTAPGAAPTPQPPDPYDVLGISQSLSASDIKKHYWKLSLRIHPDKCAHPEAPKAFQAVAAAAAELQDATRRADADERRKDSALRKEFAEFAAQQERDRQWRMARGEATAEDISGVSEKFQPRAAQRESWMTDLPPERRAAAPSPGKNQAAFQTTRPRDATSDRSAWTLTPQQRAAEAARITSGGGARGSEPLKIAPGGAFSSSRNVEARKTTTTAPTQRKSLMEQHLERQVAAATAAQRDRQGKKRKKKAANDKGGEDGPKSGDPDWDRSAHPWRPFDREKDLNVRSTSDKNDPQALLKNLPGLKSKFARGGA
jgi:curved DNA-binding protein CbpA